MFCLWTTLAQNIPHSLHKYKSDSPQVGLLHLQLLQAGLGQRFIERMDEIWVNYGGKRDLDLNHFCQCPTMRL
ncbi:hypothetical protein Pyn_22574 [Prunus yedoensis var. nudiflora]|uniref:Uncharacterized protein n=1 Tax=Prunus yedoensis var. nudiflora TaxID=2094558 RepID=A0A314ZMG6_PRUYE|nr:hypothetical protein Pyn_22574 [Prunus yedoensis var. nudiflora]